MGSDNHSPWKEIDRLREEDQKTLDAAGITAAALTDFESGSSVAGRGVPGRLLYADCERFGAKGLGATAEREMRRDGCCVEEKEEEDEGRWSVSMERCLPYPSPSPLCADEWNTEKRKA